MSERDAAVRDWLPEAESFGRYQIRARLGSGGFAEVYRASDPALQRDVALKVILAQFATEKDFGERFLQEMRLAAGLSHPNIVPVYDVGRSNRGRPFFTMGLLTGKGLTEYVRERGPISPEEARAILAPLASALDYLASLGFVHRDLKPGNIILSAGGEPMLIDFGIARSTAATHLTQTGAMIGTPHYMAPEQVRGAPVGPATDRYSLGMIAYQLLAGRLPFGGDTAQVLYKQVNEPPPLLEQVRPALPPSVSRAVNWALQKDPAARPPSASAFIAAFSGFAPLPQPGAAQRSTTVPAPVAFEERPTQPFAGDLTRQIDAPAYRRSSLPYVLGSIAALMALIALIAFLVLGRSTTASTNHAPAPTTAVAQADVPTMRATPSTAPSLPPTTAAASARLLPAPSANAASPSSVARSATAAPAPSAPMRQAGTLLVARPYGAALRESPSSDARIVQVVPCGTPLPPEGESNGWYRVRWQSQDLWVGARRVEAPASVPVGVCAGAVTFQINEMVMASVQSGCLSLRSEPARTAPYQHCVESGYRYTILNGPVEAGDEDWFEVTSTGTGSGWVLAQFLRPITR